MFDDLVHPRIGVEFDWLGTDASGRVAFFASAGYGAVPLAAASRASEVDTAIDTIGSWPTRGSFIDESDGHGDLNMWFDVAARGFYAYDWKHWAGPYVRVASPTDPLDIGELPPEVRSAAWLVTLPQSFTNAPTLDAPRAERAP